MPVRKKSAFAPDEVVIAIDSCATGNELVRRGERRRGSDPMVVCNPGLFVRDGTPPSEWPVRELPDVEPDNGFPLINRPSEPVPESELAVCVTGHTSPHGSFSVGRKQRWDEPAVQACRDFWRMLGPPVPEANGRRGG